MKTLKFINDDGETVASVVIGDTAFDQICGECPILRFQDTTWNYSDANADEYVEYVSAREFTVTVDDDRNATVTETADPDNVL